MVTIKDIAAATGVSATTVSNVVNGKAGRVSAQTIQKINNAIQELGYIPNMSARSLVSRSSKVIGFINHILTFDDANFMEDPFLSKFIGVLERILRQNGYYLMIRTVKTPEEFRNFLHTWSLDGLFLSGIFDDDFFKVMDSQTVPTVLVDSHIHKKNICNIGLDDFGGSKMSTRYLIERGHKKILYATLHIQDGGVLSERFAGYKAALKDAGIPFDPSLVLECGMDIENTRHVAEFILNNPDVTGIVTTADFLAGNIMANLHRYKIRIPEDVSVIGFDDLNICTIMEPPLTTVHQDMDKKGEIAMKFMMELIDGHMPQPCDILLPTTITERESVRSL